MELWHLLLVSLSALFSLAVAQTTDPLFDPSLCNPGSGVQFTACNSFEDVLSNCTSQQTNQGLTQCMCNQAYFSLIVDCNSELRLCFGDNTYDSYTVTQEEVWHGWCDTATTFTPTTPVLSTTLANGHPVASLTVTSSFVSSSVTVSRAGGSAKSTSTSVAGNVRSRPEGRSMMALLLLPFLV